MIGPECAHCGRRAADVAELASWVSVRAGAVPFMFAEWLSCCSTDCGVEVVNRVTNGR